MILDISKDVPTYHAYGTPGYANGSKQGLSQHTRCGRPISDNRVGIPTKHVLKFAKPCRGCFPPAEQELLPELSDLAHQGAL